MLSGFCAICEDEQLRFLAYRLLVQILDAADGATQVLMLKQLMVDCPFESVKLASLSIVRELMLTRLLVSPFLSF